MKQSDFLRTVRESFPPKRILSTMALVFAFVALGHLVGITSGIDESTTSSRVPEATKFLLAAVILYIAGIVVERVSTGRWVPKNTARVIAVPFFALFVSSTLVLLQQDIDGNRGLIILLGTTMAVTFLSTIGLATSRSFGWYGGWASLILFLVTVFAAGNDSANLSSDRWLLVFPVLTLGCFLIGLALSQQRLIEQCTVSRHFWFMKLNLLLVLSGILGLMVTNIGIVLALAFIAVLVASADKVHLHEKVLAPWFSK